MKKVFKYRLLLAVFVLLSMSVTACQKTVQMEDRNYVMALGIDYDDGELTASFSFPDLAALTGKGENIHYPVMTVSGRNLDEIERSYEKKSNRRLDYGQLQVIVFGENIFKHEPVFETVLAYIKTRQSFSRTILVCRAQNTAAEIIGLDESVNGSIGIYIREMFENNAQEAGYDKTVINDLIIAWKNKEETAELAVIRADETKTPEICGAVCWPKQPKTHSSCGV